jgi:putative spermidine/putrescine transport system substrate-binding protein
MIRQGRFFNVSEKERKKEEKRMNRRKTRIMLALFVLLGLSLLRGNVAWSEEKVVYVAGWAGRLEKMFTDLIAPDMEKKFGVKVVYTAGKAAENLAKIQAQRKNSQIDVAIVTEVVGIQGMKLGLWDSLDPNIVTNMKNMYETSIMPNQAGVLWAANLFGLIYNPKVFREKRFPVPASYNDLFRPEYCGKVIVAPITTDYGLNTLLVFAKMKGGGEKNIEPGFEMMKRLAPCVLSYEKEATRVGDLFNADTGWIAPWSHAETFLMGRKGIPIKFVAPVEGTVIMGNSVHMVKGCPNPKMAQEYINLLLGEKVLLAFAEQFASVPLNKTVKLPSQVAEYVPNKPEIINKAFKVDWDDVSVKREEWSERWAKEIESIQPK